MSNISIRAEKIGKRYQIGAREQYSTLRDTVTNIAKTPYRLAKSLLRGDSPRGAESPHLWALKDVSFDIHHGEVVGIVGRNGAGKSTLLKILSRITEPSEGRAEMFGRVGALLEVGTGFHPELTGRENIFLNGAILGLRRHEIRAKFDAIVAFSEVEKFLDTPVKFYSSGMHVRLAFAVAAHLEPEILLVDEVLAVGDSEFQKKCMGKMQDVSAQGRTVLFVSHNMASMAQLCQKGILLHKGTVAQVGEMRSVIDTYLNSGQTQDSESLFPINPSKEVHVLRIQICDDAGRPTTELSRDKTFRVVVDVLAHKENRGAIILSLNTVYGVRLCRTVSANSFRKYSDFTAGQPTRFAAEFPSNLFNEGAYNVTVWVVPGTTGVYDSVESKQFYIRDISGSDSFMGERKPDTSALKFNIPWKTLDPA